jgi:phospholipase A1/A2
MTTMPTQQIMRETRRVVAAMLVGVSAVSAPAAAEEDQTPTPRSLFERRIASELRAMNEPFSLLPHRPNHLMPLSYHRRSQTGDGDGGANDRLEAQFQISFKFLLSRPWFDGRLIPFFAYTGRSWWQVYDEDRSRPFREYNHEPELFIALPLPRIGVWGWTPRAALFGFNHQSNGRSVPDSRSWNRLTAEFLLDRGSNDWASLRLWYRLPEDPKTAPTESAGDDNPDITRYLGHFELKLGHVATSGHNLTLTARRSLRSDGKGALQADWSHPLPGSPSLRWHVHFFSGYGDSLIDYNRKIDRVGLGVMLNDWL